MFKQIAAGSFALLVSVTAGASEFSDAQAKVKAKYPKEFAEIQTLAASDMAAAQKKLLELARKGNISMPAGSSERSRWSGRGGRQGGMNSRGGRGGMGMGMGMMRFGQFNLLKRYTAESQIKSKFAAEYAAADRQLLEAVNKIEELARKAKVTLPLSTELQIRKLRAKAPEEFARLEENASKDPRSTFGALRELSEKHQIPLYEVRQGGRRDGRTEGAVPPPPAPRRESPNALLRRLRRQYPAEMKEIMALRESDPKEFARKIRELDRKSQAASGKKQN